MTTAVAIVYGVCHDLITAHVCLEYFSVAHPMLVPAFNESPTLLALEWGFLATWWMGAVVGLMVGCAFVRKGFTDPNFGLYFRYLILRLTLVGIFASLVGLLGFAIGSSGLLLIPGELRDEIPASQGPRFYYAVFSHSASYLAAGLIGLRLFYLTLSKKRIKAPWML